MTKKRSEKMKSLEGEFMACSKNKTINRIPAIFYIAPFLASQALYQQINAHRQHPPQLRLLCSGSFL